MTLAPRHVVLAALLHAALFLLLFVGVQCSNKLETPPVVQGVLINPSQIPHPSPPTPPTPPQPKPQPDQGPQPKVDAEVQAEQAKAEQKKQEEQQHAEELKKQQLAEQKQKADEALSLKKQEVAEERKREEQKQTEDMRKQAEQEEQQRQSAALAAKQKAEAAKQQALQRKQAEADLQRQLGVESGQLTQQLQNEWALQLTAAITRAWARPPGTDQSLKAYLKMTLANNGQVLSAHVSTGSGVQMFDESVLRAVYKASPLPLPRDPSAFDSNINICFSPNPQSCQQ